jgi:hypothetical protein
LEALLDIWWICVIAAGLAALVISQAWDRRNCAERHTRQEKGRVETEVGLQAEQAEQAESLKHAPPSLKA